MIDIGCCGHTDSYLAISQMGYDYVELSAQQIMELTDEEFSEFLKLYKKTGFPCLGFNEYCTAEFPLVGPGSNSDACREYAQKVCERGHALGIRSIGIGAPAARILPEGYGKEQADADIIQFLRYICPIAEKYGIMILLEAVHKYLCNYLNNTSEVLALVQRLDIPNLKIVLDYYHAEVMGEDLHALSYVIPYTRHLHIAANLPMRIRGFMREQDIPEMHRLMEDALKADYDGGISVEAVRDNVYRDGASCQQYMRIALLNT